MPGLRVIHDDDDIVVVDKPVGVAAHPSPGWTGTTVVQGLAAAGYRVSTSGAAERQGIVHRLDVGTSGVMVVAKSEPAYSALKQAFRERTVDKVYHAVAQGHLDPLRGTIDAPIDRHPVHDYRWAVVGRRQGERHALRHDRGVPGRQPPRGAPGDRAHPPDPGPSVGAADIRASATSPTVRTPPWRPSSASSASGCTPCGSRSSTRPPVSGSPSSRRTRPTSRTLSTSSVGLRSGTLSIVRKKLG